MENKTLFIIGIITAVFVGLAFLSIALFGGGEQEPEAVTSGFPRASGVRSITPTVSQETELPQVNERVSIVVDSEPAVTRSVSEVTVSLESGSPTPFETIFQPQQNQTSLSIQQVFTTIQTDIGLALVFNFLDDPDVTKHLGGYYSFEGPLGDPIPTENIATGEIIYLEPNPIYTVSYIPETSHFSIALIERPFESTRVSAVADVQRRLGITQSALCVLHINVAVPRFADPLLAGIDLGIPGCSGAYQL